MEAAELLEEAPTQKQVLELLEGEPEKLFKPAQVAELLEMSAENAQATLKALLKKKLIHKPRYGNYRFGPKPKTDSKTEPDELLEIKPDANGRDPVLVIWSDGKPWLAFYQDAAEDGTWILRSEVVGRLDMGVKRGEFKMESISDAT